MATSPILLIPYMWIGDFVRCHSVIKLLKARNPDAPVDVLTTSMVAPLLDYMPGVRKGIVVDLPRKRLAFGQHRALAARLRAEGYGQALVMPRTWKAALAPFLAGIPLRTGFVGEARFGLLNDLRWGERALPRMIDQCASLALPKGATAPAGLATAGTAGSRRRNRGLAPADGTCRPTAARPWRWRPARSARRNGGRRPPTRRWPAGWRPRATRSG